MAFAAVVGDNEARKSVVDRRPHLVWATLAHPSAVVAKSAQIGPGALICAGCVVQPGAAVAAHCVLNTRSSLDHDSTLGDFVHLGPGSTVCGHVDVGEGVFVGAGAVVKNGTRIAPWCVVRLRRRRGRRRRGAGAAAAALEVRNFFSPWREKKSSSRGGIIACLPKWYRPRAHMGFPLGRGRYRRKLGQCSVLWRFGIHAQR
uniref:Uncharacterized protein n=1 Tax=Marseillevirus LCMAC103 TaxID=2506604 RepID=A0A481YVZ2_9VIRU|nr:MAG: hypothetical protein LCMAC103_02970 [Marseillevirus LCMAC103]